MESPFLTFPLEIWEVVLKHCENPEDVLKAFPQLIILFRGKGFSWRIGVILVPLFPKLISFKDVKNCRLVSKRWKNGVDRFIETNTNLLPYGTTATSENHFNYKSWRHITTGISPCFQYQVEHCCRPHVFFPRRSVCINFLASQFNIEGQIVPWTSVTFLRGDYESSPQCLGKHFSLNCVGNHIWHVTFSLPVVCLQPGPVLTAVVMQTLVRCLSHLPNLKSLELYQVDFDVSKKVCQNIISFLGASSIPARVEALDLSSVCRKSLHDQELFNSFLTLFVNHDQVRKLVINAKQWTSELPNMLPSLTELHLVCNYKGSARVKMVKNVFEGLVNFPCLRKLCVLRCGISVAKIIQLVSTLHIESLQLDKSQFLESPTETSGQSPSIVSKIFKTLREKKVVKPLSSFASSIRHLKIEAELRMNFKFLSALPSLQFLYVWGATQRIISDQEDASDIMFQFLAPIYNNGNIPKLDIMQQMWISFPHLRIISVENSDGLKQCVREDPTKIFVSCS